MEDRRGCFGRRDYVSKPMAVAMLCSHGSHWHTKQNTKTKKRKKVVDR